MAPKINFKADFHFNENGIDGFTVIFPLNSSKKTFFFNHKKFGIPILGTYELAGKKYECNEGDCLILYDIGRGIFNYHTNWIWISSNFYLPDKRPFAFNLGDGLEINLESNDTFSGEFCVLGNKVHKLD